MTQIDEIVIIQYSIVQLVERDEILCALERLLLSMSQRRYLLSPSSCYISRWGSSVLSLLCAKD